MPSQRSLACVDEFGNSIPRILPKTKDDNKGMGSDGQCPSTSKDTGIEEHSVGDEILAPNTTHSQNLADSQAQRDIQLQQDSGPTSPSPTKRGDNIDQSDLRDPPVQRVPIQFTLASRSACTPSSHQNLTEDESKSRKVEIGGSHRQPVKNPVSPRKLEDDDRSGEFEHDAEKVKLEQWEQRKQQFGQENSRLNPKAKAGAASRKQGPFLPESSRKNVQTLSLRRPDAPASPISRAKPTNMTHSARVDAHPVPSASPAQSSKGAAALAQLDSALAPAHKPSAKSRAEVSKMPQKLVRRLHDATKKCSPIIMSPRESPNEPRNSDSPKNIELANLHYSGSKILTQDLNKPGSNKGLDVFDLEIESGSTPSPLKAKASMTSKRGKGRKTDHAAKKGPSKSNSSLKKPSRAAQRQTRVQKDKDSPEALSKKVSSTKDSPGSLKSGQTAKLQHQTDTCQTSDNFDVTVSRDKTRSQAVRTIQNDDQTKISAPSLGKDLQGLSLANASVTKGANTDEKKPAVGLQEQDQAMSYEHFEQQITHVEDGEDEANILVIDGERREIAPTPRHDSHEQKPVHSKSFSKERTKAIAQAGHDKEMVDYSPSIVEDQAEMPLHEGQSTRTVHGRKPSLENHGMTQVQGNGASAKRVQLSSTPPIDAPRALEFSLEPEGDVQPHIESLQSPERRASPLEGHCSSLKLNPGPQEQGQGSFSPTQSKEPLTKVAPKALPISSGDVKLQFNTAPKLPPPAEFDPLPVPTSSTCHSQQSIAPADAKRYQGKIQSLDLVDKKTHQKSPMVHPTAMDPMNRGVITSSTLGSSKAEVSENPAPQKRHVEEPLDNSSELRQAKRPCLTIDNIQITANSGDEIGRTTHANLQKHPLRSSKEDHRSRSMQISDSGSPLPVTVDDSGSQGVFGALSRSEHEELRALPNSAQYDLATARIEQDEDLSNAAASFCTVPTQILSPPPNFLTSNTKTRPQAPTAASQAVSDYAPLQLVEQRVREAERESERGIGPFASPSKSPSKDHQVVQPKTTRFMRSLQAQMDDARMQKGGATERGNVAEPGTTLTERRRHHHDGQSFTSTSTASTEATASEESEVEDPLAIERREAAEWEDALRPHQRDVVVVLSRITREVVRHLVAADEAVEQLVGDYEKGALELIESLERAHGEELEVQKVELEGRKEAMKRFLRGVETNVFSNGRDVRSLGLRKEVGVETQEHHEKVMSELQELTAQA
ncbi:MAG: hypothetical protein Q9165_004715 [Trypethelium subeluteriae]